MMPYINKENTLEAINKLKSVGVFSEAMKTAAIKTIENQPAADVVEVVRCKDCYFSCKDDFYENGYMCNKPLQHPQMGEKRQRKLMQGIDFCSYGIKKEG